MMKGFRQKVGPKNFIYFNLSIKCITNYEGKENIF